MSNLLFPSNVRGLAFTVVKTMENSSIVQEAPSFASTRILQSPTSRWHWRLEYTVLFDNVLLPNPSYTYTDLQIMMGFCQARYSNYDDFLFLDPDANSVGPGVITSTWQPNFQYMLGTVIIASGHAQQVSNISGYGRSGLTTPTFSLVGSTVVDGGVTWSDLGVATNGGTNWPNPQAQLQVVTDGTTSYSPLQINTGGQVWEDITDLASGLVVYDNGVVTTNYTVTSGGFAITGFASTGIYLTWTSPPTGPVTATFNYYYRVRLEEPSTDFEKFVNLLWSMGGEVGVQGKGYLKLVQASSTTQADAVPSIVWTGTGSPIVNPPTPLPQSSGPSGGVTVDDMLTWCLIPSPARTTSHIKGDLYQACMLDTDAAYPVGYPAGTFFWIKNTLGHPWDIEKYDGSNIYHWITEDGDPVDQAACHASGYTSCWIDPFAYKRFLTPVPMMPRHFTEGTTITIDTPGPNTFRRTTNCESSFTLINLGDVRAVTSGPFNMSWGGSVGTAATIQNDYYYGGKISSNSFKDKESTFYVQGYGRIAWKYYKLVSGSWQLQQSSINNILASGGCPTPSFPCGPGQSWF